jgi:hypothetical protein
VGGAAGAEAFFWATAVVARAANTAAKSTDLNLMALS